MRKESRIGKELKKYGMTRETWGELQTGGIDKNRYNELAAMRYARWLLVREGKEVPVLECRVEWGGVYSLHKTRQHKCWNGETAKREIYCRRVRAVIWGRKKTPVYNTRKDGRRGAWSHDTFEIEMRVVIPHWDFEHPPIELCEALDSV